MNAVLITHMIRSNYGKTISTQNIQTEIAYHMMNSCYVAQVIFVNIIKYNNYQSSSHKF